MKKTILLGAIALFGAMNAQTKFGAKAGYSLSTIKAESDGESESSDPKSTFYVGALVEHKFSSKFALQAEILYSPLGGKETEEGTESFEGTTFSFKSENKLELGTLLIPVGAKYYITDSFNVGAGLNFGIITSAKSKWSETWTAGGETESDSGEEDIKEFTKTLNLAPFVGAEYNLANGLFFDARYNFGVSNLAKNEDGDDYKLTNSFFQIGLGYKF